MSKIGASKEETSKLMDDKSKFKVDFANIQQENQKLEAEQERLINQNSGLTEQLLRMD